MPEGGVTRKVPGKDIPGCGEFLTDKSQAKEPCAHGVFGIFILLGLGACRLYILCHLGKRQAKLDIAFQLPCMDTAPALFGRLIELEEPKLDVIQDLD